MVRTAGKALELLDSDDAASNRGFSMPAPCSIRLTSRPMPAVALPG